jgi:hypothetical protein
MVGLKGVFFFFLLRYMYLVLLDGIPIGLYTAITDAINYSKDKGDVVVYEVTANCESCMLVTPRVS